MEGFRIRLACLEDIPQIYDMISEVPTRHDDPEDSFAMNQDLLFNYFREGFFEAKVLINDNIPDDNIYGLLLYNPNYYYNNKHGMYLEEIYVKKELRGKGLGQYLMRSLFEEAVNKDKQFIRLMYQKKLNLFYFYERFGYVEDIGIEYFEREEELLLSSLEEELQSYQKQSDEVIRESKSIQDTRPYPLIAYTLKHQSKELNFNIQMNFFSWRGPTLFLFNLSGSCDLLAHPRLFKIMKSFIEDHEYLKNMKDARIDVSADEVEFRKFLQEKDFININEIIRHRAMINKEAMMFYLTKNN